MQGREPRSARRNQGESFGTDNYTTLQEARLLETKAYRFDPDMIILRYCFNDTGNSYTPSADSPY